MKPTVVLLISAFFLSSATSVFCQTSEFYFNGFTDVFLRSPRGSGGRAIVHDVGNLLSLNYDGDFTGGTRIGNDFWVLNDGRVGMGTPTPAYRLHVNGQGLFSRDGAIECCSSANFTLALAENTGATGKKAKISFHNAGQDEGAMELTTEGGFRNIKFYDHQNQGLGITATGRLALKTPGVANSETSTIRFYSTFTNYPADHNPHYSVRLTSGYRSGVWGSEFLAIGVGGSNDAEVDPVEQLVILASGNVGIGTPTPGNYKLNVWGRVRAHEVIINTTGADFVFEDTYRLRPLKEVEQFIQQHKHLPEITPAAEMQKEGVGISELQTKLLQKIEELTLYMIEMKKENERQDKEINTLKQENTLLKNTITTTQRQ